MLNIELIVLFQEKLESLIHRRLSFREAFAC
jgi:hypothetical protein